MKSSNLTQANLLFLFLFLLQACNAPPPAKIDWNSTVENQNEEEKEELSKEHRVGARYELEFEKTKDLSTGTIPRERLLAAKNYKDRLMTESANRAGAISNVEWIERGPNNVGGRTRTLMFDPNDASNQKAYAGSVAGGLWYNSNITLTGSAWQKVDDFWDNLAVTALAYDPTNTNTFYVGTGEAFYNADGVSGDGIWKSTNGGTTWAQIASTNNNGNFSHISDIKVLSDGTVLSASRAGIFRSVNGGSSWISVQSNFVTDLEVATNGNIFAGNYAGDVLKSTDNGATWSTVLSTTVSRVEVAVAPSNSDVVYAVAAGGGGSTDCSWIKKSTDGGATWTDKTIPLYCSNTSSHFTRGQAWYDLIFHVHPTDSDKITVGGVDIHRSLDGGTTWTPASYWTGGGCPGASYVHADIHQIISVPGTADGILVGCDGGVFYSDNVYAAGTPVFTEMNTNYNVTQFYDCAIDPAVGSDVVLGGTQDNGTHSFNNAGVNSTVRVTGGDGAYTHYSDDGTVRITAYVYNNYWVSVNGGGFTTRFFEDTGRFINPTDYDGNAGKLYGATNNGQYFRWNDVTTSGTSTDNVSISNLTSVQVSAVTVSPSIANRVYFGFNDGTIAYIDGADTGTSKSATVIRNASGYISDISIDANDENHIIYCVSNYGATSVFETSNGGTSWTSVEGNLPDMPIRGVSFTPFNSDRALVATELGVWSTDDLDGTSTVWGATNSGLANVRTDRLAVRASDGVVAAATHGRGVFTTNSLATAYANFGSSTVSYSEGSTPVGTTGTCDENYRNIEVPITVGFIPSSGISIAISEGGSSSAEANKDFEITTSSLTFNSGDATSKFITLKVIDDAVVEGDETIELNLSVTSGAQEGTQTQTIVTVSDNEIDPMVSSNGTILSEEFSGGLPADWSAVDLIGGGNWASSAQDGNPTISSPTAANGWMIFDSDGFGNDGMAEDAVINLPVQDFSSYTNVKVNFSQSYTEYSASSTYVEVSTDGGVTYTQKDVMDNNTLGFNTSTLNPEAAIVDIGDVADGESAVYIRLRYIGNWDYFWLIDDLTITGEPQASPASTLNEARETYLENGQTAHLYSSDNNILATIKQMSGSAMGCVSATIETVGTAKTPLAFNSSFSTTAKTLNLTASNSSVSYEVSLFFTAAEMTVWGADAGNLNVIKSSDPLASATPGGCIIDENPVITQLPNGTYVYKATFSSFSSFALTDATAAVLPVNLIGFKGEAIVKHNLLTWETDAEVDFANFTVERSFDGRDFEKIAVVDAGLFDYRLEDADLRSNQTDYYYRLKMNDLDGSYTYSSIVLVQRDNGGDIWLTYPNPIRNVLNIQSSISNGQFTIYDASGKEIYRGIVTDEVVKVDFSAFAPGIYWVKFAGTAEDVTTRKIVKM